MNDERTERERSVGCWKEGEAEVEDAPSVARASAVNPDAPLARTLGWNHPDATPTANWRRRRYALLADAAFLLTSPRRHGVPQRRPRPHPRAASAPIALNFPAAAPASAFLRPRVARLCLLVPIHLPSYLARTTIGARRSASTDERSSRLENILREYFFFFSAGIWKDCF